MKSGVFCLHISRMPLERYFNSGADSTTQLRSSCVHSLRCYGASSLRRVHAMIQLAHRPMLTLCRLFVIAAVVVVVYGMSRRFLLSRFLRCEAFF